ncbi:hypothetical protein [Brevundimonas sp.]|uniref:hypothetical protein n=1 Tax=Brevundimonas sp. TaxID=1871086 RepID=UPI0025C12165|nr:hypothetical protein [Brevundimonas sp.]
MHDNASNPIDLFENPNIYTNNIVTACGMLTISGEDQNIRKTVNRDSVVGKVYELGVRVEKFDPNLIISNKFMCVTGVLVRTGCDDENICSWSNSSHAISVLDTNALYGRTGRTPATD